jgi:hypothetical protein
MMTRDGLARVCGVLLAGLVASSVAAEESRVGEEPDGDLLEFLGSFNADDDDWLAVSLEEMSPDDQEPNDPDVAGVERSDDEN